MKDLKLKAITALLLMTVLCALGNYLLVRRAILLIAEREQVHNERKLDSLSELNDLLEAESDDAMGQLMNISGDNIRLMSSVLARYVEGDSYTGPRTYEDGFVFELQNGEVIYPDTLPKDFSGFCADTVSNAFDSKDHFGGIVPKSGQPEISAEEFIELNDPAILNHYYGVFIIPISGKHYYADLTDGDDIAYYLNLHMDQENVLSVAERAYGGALLIVDPEDGSLTLKNESTAFKSINSALELGMTQQDANPVRRYVNRELILLCERHGIRIC